MILMLSKSVFVFVAMMLSLSLILYNKSHNFSKYFNYLEKK